MRFLNEPVESRIMQGQLASSSGLIGWTPADVPRVFEINANEGSSFIPANPLVADPISQWNDLSGNGANLVQVTASEQPNFQASPNRVNFDLVNDNFDLTITVPWAGTYIQASAEGVAHFDVVRSGTGQYPGASPLGVTSNNIIGAFVADGYLTPAQVVAAKKYYAGLGSARYFQTVTSMSRYFFNRQDIVKIYTDGWDTKNVTQIVNFCAFATSLQSIETQNLDFSSVTLAGSAFRGCTALTELDLSKFTMPLCTNYANFANGCTNLAVVDPSGLDFSSAAEIWSMWENCPNLTFSKPTTWDLSGPALYDAGYMFFGCTSVQVQTTTWGMDNVQYFDDMFRGCASQVTLDLSNWKTSNALQFTNFCRDATSLTNVIINGGTGSPFSDSLATSYLNAFTNTNLSQQSIDDILVAINASGNSNVNFTQSGGSAPSAVGQAAIDALRARGGIINVTGGY